ncbi:AarF/ABC1/UbiB kinase family protein [Virgibacillus salarius]|uniref:ABC1 kinase family protein n=1 Tax=Virgibacillus salarius TaxID=447199 RepID=UPI00047C7F0B|nr:AarF/UbiB family protein [Priestia megaterium]
MNKGLKYRLVYRCSIMIWMTIKFIFLMYKFHFRNKVWDDRTIAKWNILVTKLAREYRNKAVELGGVLIKVGQFLSTRTDFMPDAFLKELSGLVDRVPPMPFSYARKLLEEEWGGDIYEYIEDIKPTSIASASIGEVYLAKLREDHSDVAIKVQRYRVEEIFHIDFKALRIVFWLISVFTSFGKKADLPSLYRELITVMNKELDFQQELKHACYFQERFQDNKAIHIPNYIEQLCTKKVLVMEWIDGAKITDVSYMHRHQVSTQQIARSLFDFYLEQFLNEGMFHADPHAGNILIQQDGTIVIIDFGMVGEVRKQDTHYFKKLIQNIIMDDYDRVIETLDEMNFILPQANRKKLKQMIRQTIAMYQNGSLNTMDAHTMEQLKEDIRLFISDQPIQLSADYAYLGRAISIVIGILLAIYPDIDLQKWAKPKIKKWFVGRNLAESIYKQYVKDAVQPVLSFPKAMLGWLENGEKERKWEREKQQKQLTHNYFVLLEVICFVLLLVSVSCILFGYYQNLGRLTTIAISGASIFAVMMILLFMKHYRNIRSK